MSPVIITGLQRDRSTGPTLSGSPVLDVTIEMRDLRDLYHNFCTQMEEHGVLSDETLHGDFVLVWYHAAVSRSFLIHSATDCMSDPSRRTMWWM